MKPFYLLILLVASPAWAADGQGAERFLQVSGWTGHYSFSGEAECSGQHCIGPIENVYTMASPNKTSQSFSISLNLNEVKVEDDLVVWQGESSCKIQSDGKLHAWIPETPVVGDADWNVERVYPCMARLIIDLNASDYTLEVDFQDIEYSVSISGTGMRDDGTYFPVNETEKNNDTFSGPYMGFDLDVWEQLPEQGSVLMGSYDLGKKPAQGMDPEFDQLVQSISSQLMQSLRAGGIAVTGQVQWNLSPDLCSETDKNYTVEITLPSDPIELNFENQELLGSFYAEPEPNEEELRSRVVWTPFEIDGSTRVAEPENLNSDYLNLTFSGIPDENEAFGEKEISATIGSLENCTEPAYKKVTIFFDRQGTGNSSSADDPNWLWYWLQTSAGKGFRPFIRYSTSDYCNIALGYFLTGKPVNDQSSQLFFICDSVLNDRSADPFDLLSGKKLHSIDVFAIVAIHENQHRENYRKWWWDFPKDQLPAQKDWSDADFDMDGIPDKVEESLPGYDPFTKDSFNIGFDDDEVSAYQTANQWAVGSADEEDWACPGAQGQDVCKEAPR